VLRHALVQNASRHHQHPNSSAREQHVLSEPMMMMHMTGELSVQGYTMLRIHSEVQNGHNEWQMVCLLLL